MKNNLLFNFFVNRENKTINIQREFNAELELVWHAWTTPEILDQWWAPKPWKAETKSMDFTEGGHWHYAMVSPEGEKHWGKVLYISIVDKESFKAKDGFCDENGAMNRELPQNHWYNQFVSKDNQTLVNVTLTFDSLSDLEKIIEMGFRDGFIMALENLDQYIEAQFKLRKQNKTSNKARVSSYLNFDGKTEEAFLFYQKVFKTDFLGKGIERFGDIPSEAGHPPVADAIKEMVLHVELPILGGHILMGTDAPKEMGFTLTKGNNMHICLEPETRAEADRLFNQLSAGGIITMPMADMFFGAYFGEFSDRYGINWMINYQNK